MKRFLLPSVFVLMLITFAMGGGEERLVGTKWKLVEVSTWDEQRQQIKFDYSKRNIVFEFQGKNKLVVTGKTDTLFVFDELGEGEHYYEYRDQTPRIKGEVCNMPMPNLFVDNQQFKRKNGRYFANVEDNALKMFCPSGFPLEVRGKVYSVNMSFIRLK